MAELDQLVTASSLRRLQKREFGHELSYCTGCSLIGQRDKTWCPSQRPEFFNGLMIIGEGPGENEARFKVPFVGKAGQLLDKVLERVGIERERTYIANATSCKPPPRTKDTEDKKFEELHPHAVPACKPRLIAEIEDAQPRVIVLFGNQSLTALTGEWKQKIEREPKFKKADGTADDCPTCRGAITLPYWNCGQCGATNYLPGGFESYCGTSIGFSACALCNQTSEAVLGKRKQRCPQCEGKKNVSKVIHLFNTRNRITRVAGTVLRGRFAPDYDRMPKESQIDLPCHYVIPSFHPAHLLREPNKKNKNAKAQGGQFLLNALLAHMHKAKRLLTEDAFWPFDYGVVHGTEHEPAASLEELQALLATAYHEPIDVDIEADDREPLKVTKITCIGFSGSAGRTVTVNTNGLNPSHPTIRMLCAWLGDRRALKSFQAGRYDTQVLWRLWGVEVEGWKFDTMLAHNAVYPDAPHDLQHIAGQYTDTPAWKPAKELKGKILHESSEEQRIYNARDCFNTRLSRQRMESELDIERARFVHDLDLSMTRCAREMERVGLPISKERWYSWRDKATFYANSARVAMDNYLRERGFGDFATTFNPQSQPQLQWVLYSPAGPCRLTPSKYTDPSKAHPRGQPSTDKTALLAHKGHQFVDGLLDGRRWTYTLTTGLKEVVVYQDWRLRVIWNPIGARTGRWSTKGMNAQNWFKSILVHLRDGQVHPADAHLLESAKDSWLRIPGIREIVVAPPGRKLVGADLSQAEIRILAALSGDQGLIELLRRGDDRQRELQRTLSGKELKTALDLMKLDPQYDVHSDVSAVAFGQAFLGADPTTKHGKEIRTRLRDLIKRVIYGMNYGAGAETILESIYDGGYDGPPLTEEDINKVMVAYFQRFPRIREWVEDTLREAQKICRVYDGLIGRRREWPLGQIPTTEARNFKIQASVASLINLSMWELYQAMPGVDPSARLLAQVHDAIYVECDEDKAEAMAHLLEQTLSRELRLVEGAPYMPFPATAKIADDWYQAG